jgi:hypothetical protein
MKKSIILGMLAVSMLGLTACGSNSTKSSNSSSTNSSKKAKTDSVTNNKNEFAINTRYGKVAIAHMYGGPNYDPSGSHKYAISITYNVTNNSKHAETAGVIMDSNNVDFIAKNGSTEKPLDHTDMFSQIFSDNDTDGYNKGLDLAKAWTDTKIEPGKTVKVVDPNLYSFNDSKDINNISWRIDGPNIDTVNIPDKNMKLSSDSSTFNNADKYLNAIEK